MYVYSAEVLMDIHVYMEYVSQITLIDGEYIVKKPIVKLILKLFGGLT